MTRIRLQVLTFIIALALAGPAVAATASGMAGVSAAASSSATSSELSWEAYLASLVASQSGPSVGQASSRSLAVGNPTLLAASVNPLARLGGLCSLLALLLGGLFLHPRAGSLLRARLGAAVSSPFPNTRLDIETVHRLGGSQRMVSVEVDGAKMLVGLSRGRVDLLHVWDTAEGLDEAGTDLFGDDFSAESSVDTVELPVAVVADAVPTQADDSIIAPEPGEPALLSHLDEVHQHAVLFASSQVSAEVETVFEDSDLCVDSLTVDYSLSGETEEDDEPRAGDSGLARTLARVGAVGQEIDEVLSARLRARRPAPGKRGFRPPKALAAAAVYKKRNWLGATGKVASLLLILAPMLLAVVLPALLGIDSAFAAGESDASLKLELGGEAAEGSATAVKLLVVLTLLAVAPAIVLSMTSFTRMIVVFSLMRQALGIQQAPPNQILVGLALFLTWFVMAPTFNEVNAAALQPYQAGTVNEAEAVAAAMVPMKRFMLRNTRETDLGLFMRLSKLPRPETRADLPAQVLVPAFIISELKTAFQIGFLIYIPFLIIDIVVSVVLLAMGMMVLPPVVISLPFKLLLFVFVDGWNLLVSSMVQSFA